MFRIEVFVDDKKLPDALRALMGLARGQPSVMPVANIEDDGSGAPRAISNGTTLAMFERYIGTRKADTPLSPQDVRDWLKANGKSPLSATSVVTGAIEARLIRRTGKSAGVRYHVVKRLTHQKG
jgi:hypothetical protein